MFSIVYLSCRTDNHQFLGSIFHERLLNALALDLFGFGVYPFPQGAPGAMSFHDPLEGTEMRVLKLISVIDGCRIAMLFDAQTAYAFLAELFHIISTCRHLQHPFLKPVLEAFKSACPLMILMIIRVVAVSVALHRGRMGSPCFVHHGSYLGRWPQHAGGIAPNHLTQHYFLRYQDHISGGQHCLFAYTYVAPEVGVAIFITALHMNDGDIWPQRWHKR